MQKRAVIVLVLVIALASCQFVPGGEEAPTGGLMGTEGLSIQFLADTPPPRAYAPGEMLIMLLVENMGTYDLPANGGKIYLSGFDPEIIELKVEGVVEPAKPEESEDIKPPSKPKAGGKGDRDYVAEATRFISDHELTGVDEFSQRGATDIVDYKSVRLHDLERFNVDSYNTVILATACYPYKTTAATEVCIDFNPYGAAREQKVCTPQNRALGSQGAPIAVPLVEVEASKDQTHLRIHVQNVGAGTVFKGDDDTLAKCSPYSAGLGYTDVDFVNITEIKLLGENINDKCSPAGALRLNNGEGMIYCSIKKADLAAGRVTSSEFVTPLSVRLSYGYRQTTMKPIEIKKA
jgi:hypothetical protein